MKTKNVTDIIITSNTKQFLTYISAGDQLLCLWLSCQMRSLIPFVPSGGGAGRLLFSLSSLRWPQSTKGLRFNLPKTANGFYSIFYIVFFFFFFCIAIFL